jgi:hypothetical protein
MSPNCPVPFAKGAALKIGDWRMLLTARRGSKLTFTSPCAPKKTKSSRRGMRTGRIVAVFPEDGGYPTIVYGYLVPPVLNDEVKVGNPELPWPSLSALAWSIPA